MKNEGAYRYVLSRQWCAWYGAALLFLIIYCVFGSIATSIVINTNTTFGRRQSHDVKRELLLILKKAVVEKDAGNNELNSNRNLSSNTYVLYVDLITIE